MHSATSRRTDAETFAPDVEGELYPLQGGPFTEPDVGGWT
jgi:hypothetical protein